MKKLATVVIAFVLGLSLACAQLSIVPKPVSTTVRNGSLTWDKDINLSIDTSVDQGLVDVFKESLIALGFTPVPAKSKNKTAIRLSINSDKSILPEGYKLSINKNGAQLTATTPAGLFYGTQSLLQLLASEKRETPFLEITDSPRFAYRGLHLDVGRHMYPVSFIKKYIDLMAYHKFNRFHWHLTEDQGWRIEIKKYPKLTSVGGFRRESPVGRATTKTRASVVYDGKPYGGFYTQEEIKDVVAYATKRHVTIIPEIEMPGHAQAALAAYPHLGCTGGPYETATTWGVFTEVFCAGKEETFTFMQDVLDEVMTLFPGEYIHIGGDECPKTRWKECPNCQKRIQDQKLKDEHELQSYFIGRVEKYLNSRGRQIIGWDEILEGGLAPNATVMSWRGEEGGIAAAREKHNVIMTPGKWVYLDYYQDTAKTEPIAIIGYTPVSKVYSYEPIPPQLSAEESKYVIGSQCNVWSEYMKTADHVEYMVYPRACAMSEVLWSTREGKNYDDFLQRMKVHLARLRQLKVNYARHIEREFK
ncbi:MAG TPA: beta-N-acetylhexosaminidase [Chryseosolibacter sp.]